MKEAVKTVRSATLAKKTKETVEELSLAFKALDKAAKGGVIKKGTANRKKSRLAKAIAKATTK
jgi:small subunit ribosomal protein S20